MGHIQLLRQGDELQFIGSLLESDDLASVTDPGVFKRFNFDKLVAINSLGLRALASVMQKPAARAINFCQCRPVLLDAINIVPALLGTPPDPKRVRTAYIRMVCVSCTSPEEILTDLTGESVTSLRQKLKQSLCKRCRSQLQPECDLADELMFLTLY